MGPLAGSYGVPDLFTLPLRILESILFPPLDESRLRMSESVQGNVLAAFNKDHQAILLLVATDRERVRDWLAEVEREVSTTREVEDFNSEFSRRRRASSGSTADMAATWLGISLTYPGLQVLWSDPEELDRALGHRFPAFRQGPGARAHRLGDIGPSAPADWRFGGPLTAEPHMILTVAADREDDLSEAVRRELDRAQEHGVRLVERLDGAVLPAPLTGHEHFGFKDGISQPGVRGFHRPSGDHPGERDGYPGQALIAPGEFVLGYATERGGAERVPAWMREGSFHVVRRLAQDVPKWNRQLEAVAGELDLSADELGALLVGRRQSGEPLASDGTRRGESFDFADDPDGDRTPRFSHIRKSNPRAGKPGDRQVRRARIMRRGIPYGWPYGQKGGSGGARAQRGLLFACFCASLEQQFEVVQGEWSAAHDFPQPDDGPDPLVGPDGVNRLRLARRRTTIEMHACVQTTGAVYGFTPSKDTLRRLAAGDL